ncbi:MAG TPA: 16S rRNA (guanine(527)-N(7))-methyltransferase RsmG [Nitrospirae bacterium]|nr:ribosomal RNA small subunit methyltransferase G [bacterium BMS3Abin09]GBE40739.1 ribosomal RNA small subunit methyltransferase G [bacterium BMS3Bbin09]HDH34070.1 16S rRNA (guanine(527)-N(7))-methyltransferase RsmG [Nitrospirota bacterium]HDZ83716.1 16S rRNA (guanine(527)-N(7))-methyltransferase RsmG [Nitrospirota bacterium]
MKLCQVFDTILFDFLIFGAFLFYRYIMKNEELLKKGLEEAGISCSEIQLSFFMVFLKELKKWNRTYNLSALKTDQDIIIKHFIDSLLYLKAIPDGQLRIADVGAGAGFPGIPIKIARPEIDMTLIEPTGKKALFQRHIIRLLGLSGINVLELRVEEIGKDEAPFDIIVSRATFSLGEFLKMTCPYIKEEGLLIVSKGPKVHEELKEDDLPVRNAVKEVIELRLPLADAVRNLVVLQCNRA